VRRPVRTVPQRRYDRQMRALRRLRMMAVRFTNTSDAYLGDALDPPASEECVFALNALTAAADAYTNTLTKRERKELSNGKR
jgi:hypothetical protein